MKTKARTGGKAEHVSIKLCPLLWPGRQTADRWDATTQTDRRDGQPTSSDSFKTCKKLFYKSEIDEKLST